MYPDLNTLETIADNIKESLSIYKDKHNIEDVAIGMSGGVDSALTAALFKQAGWTVHGATLPINQIETETDRGQEAQRHLDLKDIILI